MPLLIVTDKRQSIGNYFEKTFFVWFCRQSAVTETHF